MVEHENIALIPKFGFESKEVESFLKEANEKYSNLYMCNVSLDRNLVEYIKEKVKVNPPFVISKGKIVEKV